MTVDECYSGSSGGDKSLKLQSAKPIISKLQIHGADVDTTSYRVIQPIANSLLGKEQLFIPRIHFIFLKRA